LTGLKVFHLSVRPFSFLFDFLRGPKLPLDRVNILFFGIGNPGRRYRGTRQNIGFAVVDRMSRSLKEISKYRGNAWTMTVGRLDGLTIALVKPTTYVNVCGKAFSAAIAQTSLPLQSCMVIVDDYHIPLGAVRMRPKGSHGGHNGLKSIIEEVGIGFPRIRVGIGPLLAGTPSVDFVLGSFAESEWGRVEEAVQKTEEAMKHFAAHGIDAAMNKFNK
jgi:PTH1 family peptidyl-tRNA hydrolase